MNKKFANVQTELPGPKAKELLDRRHAIVPDAVGYGIPTFVDSAKGALLKDVDGNEFIDFAGAIGTINAGHSHETVTDALHDQIDRYIHTGFNVMMYDPYIELAEKIAKLAPGSFDKKVMFLNSGAEAVENAVKIARKYTKRQAVVSFAGGFHGRTLMTMSLTGKVKPFKYEYGPFAPEVYRAAYPYFYRRPETMSEEEYSQFLLDEMEDFFIKEVAPEQVAAVIMEPVQGESGFIIPDKAFVQGISELCKKHGILLIADEIQTGFGRTGKYFAMEHFGVEPDLITVSKSMAAGLPISGVIGRKEVMNDANAGELGGTYAGSPLGCRAGLAVLEVMEKENLNARADVIGQQVMTTFKHLYDRFDVIGEVRGLGAMCAMEFVKDRKSKTPDKQVTDQIFKEAQRRGVVALKAGVHDNVLRLLMPLVITDEQLKEGLEILEESIEAVLAVSAK
ncbi:4-aminobutyrate aminotransferase/(S)-3-amino-2-methylpropionate transaminase [Virgibacillus natechei]|uniref:(S)-3-amino-2-methylpropionate transaminase n=1 Tax=Virgibacillus natechei TaxID=1216297 RepID=A0ABS4IGP0_9BACI|nr:4-aminobutyrate--2-oxoglutarate transaminase [Virgibacillus natechei]MBP1970095.1 4-aminobutyrate aminotransferase/(S)-3-amino-2-methylpropionate transaminase [Virgibacillus natechei]UZD14174.1 4-aminobutyrate--2-oxoglutarate transaminase [Virgibacillus natechei]